MGTPVIADIDDDELFDLDIALLDGRRDDHAHHSQTVHSSSAAIVADDEAAGAGHALLANCLLPVRSVSNAVSPSSYPYSGYYGSRRLLFTGGGSSRRFLGRWLATGSGSSARLCFSSRGFETMRNYFQRY